MRFRGESRAHVGWLGRQVFHSLEVVAFLVLLREGFA